MRKPLASRRRIAALAACAAIPCAALILLPLLDPATGARASINYPAIAQVEYGPQKVIYHVNTRGTWRDRSGEAWRLVHVLNNHIRAIEPDDVDIRVVLQGDGIDALTRAKSDANLAMAFDQLRKRGVRFRICYNTLQSYRLAPEDLHGVTSADFVQAGVAEITALQKQGFSYIRF